MKMNFSIPRLFVAMALVAGSALAFGLPVAAGDGLPPLEQHKALAQGEGVNANPNADQKINAPLAPTLYYRMIPGTAFRARGSGEGFTYSGQGCARRTQTGNNGDALFTYFLDLPDQATLKYLRTYVYAPDSNTHNAAAYITKFDAQGSAIDAQAYSISPGVGYFSVIGNEITETMDTYASAYTLQFFVDSTSYSLCGMRVAYYMPVVYAAYLPVVLR